MLAGDGTSETVALAILDRQRGLTPALAMQSPQISGLIKDEAGAIATAKALSNALLYTAHQFNVVRNMATLQMGILADELLELYWSWRFDEFLYMLKEGVRQTWGQTYDRLDSPTVHGWCLKYAEVRESLVEREAARKAEAFRKEERATKTVSGLAQNPDYADVRAQLVALNDEQLNSTWRHYQTLAGEDNEFIAAVATEVVNERKRDFYLGHIHASLPKPPTPEETVRWNEADYKAQKLAWLNAGGTKGEAAREAQRAKEEAEADALVTGAEVVDPTAGPFPPACPRCGQRRDHCLCLLSQRQEPAF